MCVSTDTWAEGKVQEKNENAKIKVKVMHTYVGHAGHSTLVALLLNFNPSWRTSSNFG